MQVNFTVPIELGLRAVTGQDSFGNDVYGTTPTLVDGVFAPGSSSEIVQGQDIVTTQPTVYLPTGTPAQAIDNVTVGGLKYEVDGDPAAWPPHPVTGWQPDYSVVVKLRRVTG